MKKTPRVSITEAPAATAPGSIAIRNPLAALLAGHVLQDGETVLYAIKPSKWFILISSLKFLAACAIVAIAAVLISPPRSTAGRVVWAQGFALIAAARLAWGLVQWMGRYYLLTEIRVLRLSGVFAVDVWSCPLRKMARTRLLFSPPERMTMRGTLELIPADESHPVDLWQTVRDPAGVKQVIDAAVARARSGSHGA